MQLMRQATLAVACMALSAAALAQVRGIYVVPDAATKGYNNISVLVVECAKFDPKVREDTPLKCTYIPQAKKVDGKVTGRPEVLLFWVTDQAMLCVWTPWGYIPRSCR